MPISNEIDTTSLVVSDVSWSPRMIDAVDQRAEQGGEDEQHDEERDRCGPAPREPELPVGERGEHADRALGEVEDARSSCT